MIKITSFAIVFLTFFTGHSQNFTNYTVNDGLIPGFIYDIQQDNLNNIYVCSWNANEVGYRGLGKFDGTNWTTFQLINESTLENSVRDLELDNAGNLWIATDAGLTIYNGSIFETVRNFPPLASLINQIFKDRSGNMWIAGAGVMKYDGTTWTTVDYFVDRWATAITQDANGNMWFASRGIGVIKFDGVNYTLFDTSNGLSSTDVYEIHSGNGNDVWVGNYANVGLDRFDGASWRTYTNADGISDVRVRAITKDSAGNMYFGHSLGYSKFDGSAFFNHTSAENGFVPGLVRSLYIDNTNHLWIGSYSGVSKMNETLDLANFSPNSGLKLYPNPVKNTLQIDNFINIQLVTIFDLQGKILQSDTLDNVSSKILDLSSYNAGLYIVKVTDVNGTISTHKIYKE